MLAELSLTLSRYLIERRLTLKARLRSTTAISQPVAEAFSQTLPADSGALNRARLTAATAAGAAVGAFAATVFDQMARHAADEAIEAGQDVVEWLLE